MIRQRFSIAILAALIVDTLNYPAISLPQQLAPNPALHRRGSWAPKKAIDDAIASYRIKYNIPGMSVSIVRNGKLVYARGFGFADIEQQKAAHAGTIFRLASVSKLITAALTMRLVDRGVLSLDQTTRTYVPTLPQHHTHTMRQLMRHQSGIRHYQGSKRPNCEVPNNQNWQDFSDTQYPTATAATTLFRSDPLMFSPATKTCYSTHAYTVLGAALEGATKVPYSALVNRELTQGLNLPTLRAEFRNQPNPERATTYRTKDANGKNVPSQRDNLSWKYPGGGLEASSVDLARLGMKLLDGSFLSQRSHDDLWRGRSISSHSGAQNGASSHLRLYFKDKIVVAILSNRDVDGAAPGKLADTIGSIVLKGE